MKATQLYRKHNGVNSTKWESQALQRKCDGISGSIQDRQDKGTHFTDKGTKVDGRYIREMLLQNCLLPDIRQLCGGEFVCQQDGAPSHGVKLTVEFLQ